jgi:hypothetical protein
LSRTEIAIGVAAPPAWLHADNPDMMIIMVRKHINETLYVLSGHKATAERINNPRKRA